MSNPAPASATETTTLTTARQSSELLQQLRSIISGRPLGLRRYLARGGDPNARFYQALQGGSFHLNSEEHTGPGAMVSTSLLQMCCFLKWTEQIGLLVEARADLDSDLGTGQSPMCTAASKGMSQQWLCSYPKARAYAVMGIRP